KNVKGHAYSPVTGRRSGGQRRNLLHAGLLQGVSLRQIGSVRRLRAARANHIFCKQNQCRAEGIAAQEQSQHEKGEAHGVSLPGVPVEKSWSSPFSKSMKVAAIRDNADPTGLVTRYAGRDGVEKLPRSCFRLKGERPVFLANIGRPAI